MGSVCLLRWSLVRFGRKRHGTAVLRQEYLQRCCCGTSSVTLRHAFRRRQRQRRCAHNAGFASIANGQRFAPTSRARRLAQAAAPAPGPSPQDAARLDYCPQGPYIKSGATNHSVFDQLTVAEYLEVVDFVVRASTCWHLQAQFSA